MKWCLPMVKSCEQAVVCTRTRPDSISSAFSLARKECSEWSPRSRCVCFRFHPRARRCRLLFPLPRKLPKPCRRFLRRDFCLLHWKSPIISRWKQRDATWEKCLCPKATRICSSIWTDKRKVFAPNLQLFESCCRKENRMPWRQRSVRRIAKNSGHCVGSSAIHCAPPA